MHDHSLVARRTGPGLPNWENTLSGSPPPPTSASHLLVHAGPLSRTPRLCLAIVRSTTSSALTLLSPSIPLPPFPSFPPSLPLLPSLPPSLSERAKSRRSRQWG